MSDLSYSCILFDLDGTVIDTVADCACAINRTMEIFSFPKHTNDEVRSYLNNGARMLIRRALPEKEAANENLLTRCFPPTSAYTANVAPSIQKYMTV